MVSLGHFHGAMENIKSGKNITNVLIKNTRSLRPLMLYYLYIKLGSYSFHLGRSPVDLATHLLQFIFLSDCGFRFPLAHFPTKQCPPSTLYLQFWEGVMQMKRAGFTYVSYLAFWLHFSFPKISLHSYQSFCSIYHAICDGGDPNRQFINIHFPDANPRELHFTAHNILTEDPMIFIMDCKVFLIVVYCCVVIYVLFEDQC